MLINSLDKTSVSLHLHSGGEGNFPVLLTSSSVAPVVTLRGLFSPEGGKLSLRDSPLYFFLFFYYKQ